MKSIVKFLTGNLILICTVLSSYGQLMQAPEIDLNNRVTFNVNAPNAKVVKVINQSDEKALGAKEYNLTKNEKGVWSVITNPCRPGLHYYKLSIDGFECADPFSQAYFGWGRWSSCIEIPDSSKTFYLPQNTAKGEVVIHWYQSKVTGTTRKCLVYTPPGYQKDANKRYPVLYLQHGSGESELAWTMQGKVNFILDNLIAENKAVPMIIVMDNGYAASPNAPNQSRPSGEENKFEEMLINDLIPEIDSQFRTVGTRESRAIAGLSMGAGQAQRIGFNHLNLFASIGAFSGGARNFEIKSAYSGVFSNSDEFNRKVKIYWIGFGKLDNSFESGQELHKTLTENNINHIWYESDGSHEWQVWRHHIYEFAQCVFR